MYMFCSVVRPVAVAGAVSDRATTMVHLAVGAPGVIVVQEWWGVDEDILHNAAKVAAQGYRALVPDLYRGKVRP